jgi:hypothetical protein
MKRLLALPYTLILAALISSLAFGEVRLVTQPDVEWGPSTDNVTSAGGHVGGKIPRYFSSSAFSDNLSLYSNDLITKGPWVDVRAYIPQSLHAGIKARTDNTALQTYIQLAIDSLSGKGGVVFFPPGLYHITAPVNLKENDTWLRGIGGGHLSYSSEIINDNTAGGVAVFIGDMTETSANTSHLHSIGIKELSIYGNASSGDGVYTYNAGVIIEDVNLYGHGRDGYHQSKWGWSFTFNRVNFQNNGRHGFYSNDSLNAGAFRDCTFLGHTAYSGAYIQAGLWGSNSVKFDTCDFEGNKYGITFEADYGMKDISVENTNFEGNVTLGIRQIGAANFDSFKLIGNTFSSAGQGVELATARGAVVTGGYFSDCGVVNAGSSPIILLGIWTDTGVFTGARAITVTTSELPTTATPNGSIVLSGDNTYNLFLRENSAWVPVKTLKSATVTPVDNMIAQNLNMDTASDWLVTLDNASFASLTVTFSGTARRAGDEITIRFQNGAATVAGAITLPATVFKTAAIVIPSTNTSTTIRLISDGNGYWWESSRSTNAG